MPQLPTWLKNHGANLLIFILFVAGIFIFLRQIQHVDFHDVLRQLKALPPLTLLLAFAFSIGGYLSLIGYDWSALRYVGKKLPLPFIAFTSFVGFSLSNTIGVSWLSGGAVRYRLYSRAGLSSTEIALIITFCVVGFGIGEVLVGGIALVASPFVFADYFSLSPLLVRAASLSLMLLVLGLLLFRSRKHGEIKWKDKVFKLPSTSILLGQIVFSILDIGFAGACLYMLLPESDLSFLTFLAVFAVALVIGVLSHVPGGVGVFEAVMITALQDYIPLESLTVALLGYRVIYYLVPFVLGVLLLIIGESYVGIKKYGLGNSPLEGTVKDVAKVASGAIPAAIGGLAFLSGILLFIGSSVNLSDKTLALLIKFFPLELIELSHILGGIVGMILILLAYALWQRVRAAVWLTSLLLLFGAVLSYLQTLDFDRVVFLGVVFVILMLSRREFYRKARLFSGVFNLQWFLVSMAALAIFAWLLYFSFKAVDYQDDLWWQFALDKQISRGLRTLVMALTTYLIIFVFYALRAPRQTFSLPDDEALAVAGEIIAEQDNADANFVFTGDKSIMFSDDQNAFIMFGTKRRSWIALGDPIGSESEQYELLWQFKQHAEDNRCKAVFYQVSGKHLEQYINAGFNLFKLGEEAWIDLNDFSLEGSKRRKLRQADNASQRDGLSFKLAYPPHSDALLDQLEVISSEWMQAKQMREKGFSLGKFDRNYLSHFPFALVYEKEKITAFANLLTTGTKQESTIDLMRHSENISRSTMEFLFTQLMLSLKEQGYQRFSLGMAPLSGLEDRQGARRWDKFGSIIYKGSGDLYNFEGLRQFKSKFKPEWKPKYLATNKGVNPYLVMVDIAALISGDILGVITKESPNKSN